MSEQSAGRKRGKALTENQRQVRNAVIVYAIIELFVFAVFFYKILR